MSGRSQQSVTLRFLKSSNLNTFQNFANDSAYLNTQTQTFAGLVFLCALNVMQHLTVVDVLHRVFKHDRSW